MRDGSDSDEDDVDDDEDDDEDDEDDDEEDEVDNEINEHWAEKFTAARDAFTTAGYAMSYVVTVRNLEQGLLEQVIRYAMLRYPGDWYAVIIAERLSKLTTHVDIREFETIVNLCAQLRPSAKLVFEWRDYMMIDALEDPSANARLHT